MSTPAAKPSTPTTQDQSLIDLLKHHDILCPICNYNLRCATTCACPECGRPFDFKSFTQKSNKLNKPFVITLIMLAMTVPESLIKWQSIMMSGEISDGISISPPESIWQYCLQSAARAFWLVAPICMLFLLKIHLAFKRLPRKYQWLIAFIATFLVVLAFRRQQFWYYFIYSHGGSHRWDGYFFWEFTELFN
ncbi:hypothetical protein JD969_19055 [Planctomycetota bacterium]|nr:hypothetical protein JD969_19055 [Planctomycetota bacterium]